MYLLFALLAGCGECTFEETVTGTVTDAEGAPIEGAQLEVCSGEGCDLGPSDTACLTTTTDATGAFVLDVPMCRPAPAECALRPIVVEKEGCESATVEADRGVELAVTLECTGG